MAAVEQVLDSKEYKEHPIQFGCWWSRAAVAAVAHVLSNKEDSERLTANAVLVADEAEQLWQL